MSAQSTNLEKADEDCDVHAMVASLSFPTSVIRRNVVRPEGANVIPSSFSCGQVESAMDTVNKSQGLGL